MNSQPSSAGHVDPMVELNELLNQLSDVSGPSPEQVAILDHALEPYLGVIGAVDPNAGGHLSTEGAGASIDGGGQGAAASHTGLVSGKLLGVLGSVVIVGAVLWGVAPLYEPPVQSVKQSTARAPRDTGRVTGHDNDPAATHDSRAGSGRERPAEPVHANTPAVQAAEHAAAPRTSTARDSSHAERTKQAASKPPAPRATSRPGRVKSGDWASELERLKRAEAALKGGRVDAALALLHDGDFVTLRLNARALEAAALCAGDTNQRQRGAALARQLAKSERSALLVRRLMSCMARD